MAPNSPQGAPAAERTNDPARFTWGILSTGRIARTFAEHLKASRTGVLQAVGSRTIEAASAFAERHQVPVAHGSYEDLLADPQVDAVYVATPHPMHASWSIRAAEAGKHVLCEKPLCMNLAQAEAVVEAAIANRVFLMEAFMYRCHPQTAALVRLLEQKVVGEVRFVRAVHSFAGPDDPAGRHLAPELGGGGILDVGCYAMSGARLVAGEEPESVTGAAHIGPTGADEWATASLRFPGGVVAELMCGVRVNVPPELAVFGTEGSIVLRSPWLPTLGGAASTEIEVARPGRRRRRVRVTAELPLYAYQADVVADAVARGRLEPDPPAPTWADTLANMRALDAWRRAVGLTYDQDTERGLTAPVHGRPLRVPVSRSPIPTGQIDGARLPVSRIVLGGMVAESPANLASATVVFDAYIEAGGNAFDTGWVYGRGYTDSALGFWMHSRGVRDQVVVVAKGAHTPFCDPESLTRQLHETLERLRTGHVEVYLMHRDNPRVAVGEFVDVLNEHVRAGRIGAFGGSNWTAGRIEEANEYAASRGLRGFTVVSNQFSLARMIVPTYEGTVGANTPEFRAFLERTQTPNLAWSSQASGFFAGLAEDGFLAHAWFEAANLERRRRAERLAADKGCSPTTIALAWILAQRLPILPIIGPRSAAELRSSLQALDVRLTDDEAAWLDLTGEGGGAPAAG